LAGGGRRGGAYRRRPHGEHHLLAAVVATAVTLEHAQHEAAPQTPAVVEHIAHVERDELVSAKPRAEHHREEDVVPQAGAVLARHAQQGLLLALRQRAGRSADRHDVRSHAGMTASFRGEGKARGAAGARSSPTSQIRLDGRANGSLYRTRANRSRAGGRA
jgi:hypothetical protein